MNLPRAGNVSSTWAPAGYTPLAACVVMGADSFYRDPGAPRRPTRGGPPIFRSAGPGSTRRWPACGSRQCQLVRRSRPYVRVPPTRNNAPAASPGRKCGPVWRRSSPALNSPPCRRPTRRTSSRTCSCSTTGRHRGGDRRDRARVARPALAVTARLVTTCDPAAR